jgi:tRNA1(Val) A37 N6-methylase TrmN6
MAADAASETTRDAALGGRLMLRQPRKGHRFGHDAILLAAMTQARAGEHAVELGAGVGAAGLALAQRVSGLRVTLIEIDPALAALAEENAAANDLSDRVRVIATDVADARGLAAHGLTAGSAGRVLMNPPFNDPVRQNVSPDAARRRAHAGTPETLSQWVDRAATLLAPSGTLTLIWRADGLADVLAALRADFGDAAVLPVHPRPDAAAIRILVRAVKGSGAPLALLPPLVLNGMDGRPSAAAEAILRDGATLPISP